MGRLLTLVLIGLIAGRAVAADKFEVVATHPDAAEQKTADGKVLARLQPFNGKLYAGYGDYNANTGPINVRAFDPKSNAFGDVKVTVPTEALFNFRVIGKKCYAANIDTTGAGGDGITGYAVGEVNGKDETWTETRPITGIHAFEAQTYDGKDLFVAGSRRGDDLAGVIWRSTDGGTTWEESLVVKPNNKQYKFNRFSSLGKFAGRLWAQELRDDDGSVGTKSMFYDGKGWQPGPDLLPNGGTAFHHPEEFARHMVYTHRHTGVFASRMYKFDGRGATSAHASEIYDFTIAGQVLLALLTDGRIIGTKDLNKWEELDTAPKGARSLAVLDGRLYVGTAESTLLRYRAKLR